MRNINLYFKNFTRNLKRNKVTSVITITGFSFSIAVVILLSAFLVSEKSYEFEYPNINNIYRVIKGENGGRVEEIAGENLVKNIPQVKAACRYGKIGTFIYYNKKRYNGICVDTDTGLFSIFSLNLQFSKVNDVFQSPKSVVLTKKFAKTVFGNMNPMGQVIEVNNGANFTVTGVCNDFPEKSILKGDFFISYKDKWAGSGSTVNGITSWFNNLFVLLEPNADTDEISKIISKEIFSIQIIKDDNKDKILPENVYRLQPLKDVYFDTSVEKDNNFQYANVELIKLLGWVTLIIIVLAIINYINLVTASGSSRMKDVGIRKTLGVKSFGIFKQYIAESLFATFLSFVLAIGIAILIKPVFNGLTGKNIEMFLLFSSPLKLAFIISFVFFIGIIAGTYPAIVSSSFTPIQILRQIKLSFDDAVFRRLINVVQFSISIFMIICLIVIIKQVQYAKNKDLGFESEQLIRVHMQGDIVKTPDVIRDYLLKNPNITDITFSNGCPGNIWMWEGGNELNNMNIPFVPADENFIKTLGLQLIAGRNFFPDEKDKVIINENLLKITEWETYEGRKVLGREVVGVVKNFHFQDLHTKIGPLMIVKETGSMSLLTANLSSHNMNETIDYIRKFFMKHSPKYDFEFSFYDENFDEFFKQEERYADTIKVFGFIAILLSCMGLFGLAEFSSKKRTKEIGVRKINGAGISEVVSLLSRDFLMWVIVAYFISAPFAWITMNKWLQHFAYKTELSWWIFLVSGIIAIFLALITVIWLTLKAATKNPVEALRYE